MYLIEGNIGAGKSTFLHLMQEELPEVKALFEPITSWSETQGSQSLLSNFYRDTPRWSYTMETFTLFTRTRDLMQEIPTQQITLAERSLYSGYYCFAKNGYLQGQMTDLEWLIYTQWFEFLIPQFYQPKGFIYLKSSPKICYERTIKRNRQGEETISLAYLEQIHHQHEMFLVKKEGVLHILQSTPVLVIDVSCEFEQNRELIKEYASELKRFIELTYKK